MSLSSTLAKTAPHPDETIVAVSSAPGPAPRAIVRLSGPGTRDAVMAVFQPHLEVTFARHLSRRLVPGELRLTGLHSPLPATLYFFSGPRTYTGQDLAEIHLISSAPLLERLVSDLLSGGARPAQPGEFTLRAFLAGKKDLPQAEAVQAIVEAGSDADLRNALAQMAGGVSQPLHELRNELMNLLADLEAALDFADEDLEFVSRAEALKRLQSALDQVFILRRQFDERSVSGRPIRIAIVGLPNVGKSSLFNVLAGSDALVSDEAGTTRDYLSRTITIGGLSIDLIDTAGWESAADTNAQQAQKLGREQADRADGIVWCVEAGGSFDPADEVRLRETGAVLVRVWTKCDLDEREMIGVVRASVRLPGGTAALREELLQVASSLVRTPLAPSQSRCRHHVEVCLGELARAREQVESHQSPELAALSLRAAIDELGEMTGAVYTNDLLDRIFSRFCIGK